MVVVKKLCKRLLVCFATALMVVGVTCTTLTQDNPLSPSYRGNYGFSVELNSLPDTLVVLRPYTIIWADTGKDSLWRLEVGTIPQGKLDTTILRTLGNPSQLILYFTDTLSGTLEFGGIRPNRQRIGYSHSITVINPFFIVGDTVAAAGKPLHYTIGCRDNGAAANIDSVRWQGLLGLRDTTLAYSDRLELTSAVGEHQFLQATLIDTRGNRVPCSPLTLKVTGSTPPSKIFKIQLRSAPETIIVNRKAQVIAQVLHNDSVVSDSTVSYHWTVEPDSGWVNVDLTADTLSLLRADSIESVKVSLYAIIGGVQTYAIDTTIKVWRYAPQCSFDSDLDSVLVVGESLELTLNAFDSNPGDTLDTLRVFYKYLTSPYGDTTTKSLGTTSSWIFKPDSVGEYIIGAWVEDRDGNHSNTAQMKLTVLAAKPSFIETTAAIDTFVNDRFVLRAAAKAGSNVDSVVEWLWDFNGDGSVDKTTKVDSLEVMYATAEVKTIKVNLRTTRGDSAQVSKLFSLTINAGKPTLALSPVTFSESVPYVRDKLQWAVTVSDANGIVTRVFADWDNDGKADASIGSGDDAMKMVTFTKVYGRSESGTHTVKFWCMDEDRVFSDTADTTIFVHLGAPSIDSFSVKKVWVVDSTPVVIHSSDVNDSVIMHRVDWNTDGVWDDSLPAADTLWHQWNTTFGDATTHFWVQVMDEDSIFSTIKACSVLVHWGRPVLGKSSNADGVQWVGDTLFIPNGGTIIAGNISVGVDTTDSNGIIEQYFWEKNGYFPKDTITDVPVWLSRYKSDTVTTLTVTARDNDGIMSNTITFIVFPDNPPIAPTDLRGERQDSSIVFKWRKAPDAKQIDVKDMDSTKVQIYYAYNGNEPKFPVFEGVLPTVGSLKTEVIDGHDYCVVTFTDKNYRTTYGDFKVEYSDSRGSKSLSTSSGHFYQVNN